MMPVSVEIRRGTGRFVEREAGRLSRHSFSFGERHDPDNLRFGRLVCHDDHLLGRGSGFAPHRHSGLVIVSYVVSGAVEHTDASGSAVVGAGRFAVLRAGDGVEHSEVAAAPQTRFVQAWLADDAATGAASYDVVDGPTVAPLDGAELRLVRVDAGQIVVLPEASRVHLYVVRGALLRSSLAEPLQEGDAFRFVDEPAREVVAAVPTDLLVWTLDER